MRVLIIDDSPTNLMIFTKVAQSVGCLTTVFSDPLAALDAFPTANCDLAIIDYQMPSLNGLGVLKRIRALPGCADIPLVMVTANGESTVRYAALDAGATDFLKRPIDPVEVKSRLRNLLKLRSAQNALRDRANRLAKEVAAATQTLADRAREIIFRLARAAESRDSGTGSHIVHIAVYSRLIAETLGLSADQCDTLQLAASMHDVGKIAVPDSVLLKPSKLAADERIVMEQHTLRGEAVLSNSQCELIPVAALIAGSHHECWDGSGYPRRLASDKHSAGRADCCSGQCVRCSDDRAAIQAALVPGVCTGLHQRARRYTVRSGGCGGGLSQPLDDVVAYWTTSQVADETKSAA